MKNAMVIAFALMSLALTNCGRANFGASDSSLSSKGATDGVTDPSATDDQVDPADDDRDPNVIAPTIDEVIADPAVLAQALEDFDCCLKHGQGKGVEVCNSGMDTCMRAEDIKANAAMLMNATIGRCGR